MKKKKNLKEADIDVINALYKSALNGSVQAQIFWLTNRLPKLWNKNPVHEEMSDTETGVIFIPEVSKKE